MMKEIRFQAKRKNTKGPLPKVLEFLLLKASLSLKIKVSERKYRQLLLQPKNAALRRISRHPQRSKPRKDQGVEEAKVSETEIGSSSSYDPENTRSSTVGRPSLSPSSDHRECEDRSREFQLMTKACSRRINPGLYLFIVILFLTVVWGRVRAVLFALVVLYSFPVRGGFLR